MAHLPRLLVPLEVWRDVTQRVQPRFLDTQNQRWLTQRRLLEGISVITPISSDRLQHHLMDRNLSHYCKLWDSHASATNLVMKLPVDRATTHY